MPKLPTGFLRCFRRLPDPSLRRGFTSTAPTRARRKLARPPPKTQGEKTVSLLEELFPKKTTQPRQSHRQREDRLVPRQGLGIDVDDGENDFAATEKRKLRNRKIPRLNPTLPFNDKCAVLLLSRVSKLLSEEDFRKVVPRGRHIKEWAHMGQILKVIKMRDPITMAPNGGYFIILDSKDSAHRYLARVRSLHYQAGGHTKKNGPDPYSPFPPPPTVHGASSEDHLDPVEAYALIPPSQIFNMSLIQKPYKPVIRNILETGGYPILTQHKKSDHEVLISSDPMQLSLNHVRTAVVRDGIMRGVKWATVELHPYRELLLSLKADRKVVTKGSVSQQQEIQSLSRGEGIEDYVKKYIISFEDEDEAKRFVNAWHRRNIADLLSEFEDAEVPPIVNAELIW